MDVSLSSLTGHSFALFVRAYLSSEAFHSSPLYGEMAACAAEAGGQAPTDAINMSHIGKIAANPEQSKNLETATARVLGHDLDFVNLRKEVYDGDSRIPTMVRCAHVLHRTDCSRLGHHSRMHFGGTSRSTRCSSMCIPAR